MSKDGTFSTTKSAKLGRRIFKILSDNIYIILEKRDANILVIFINSQENIINIPKKYKVRDNRTGELYGSHEFDKIPCFVLSKDLNDFDICEKNKETKEWEAIFWFDKMDIFSVNHSAEVISISRDNKEFYQRIQDKIQSKFIDNFVNDKN
jgi:hypothetical protein